MSAVIENDNSIEAQLLEAAIDSIKSHVKDGKLNPGDIVERLGNNDGVASHMTMQVTDARRDAEFVTVYSTKDGMPSEILVNMLAKTLMKRWNNDPELPPALHGQKAFSLKPVVEYRSSDNPLLCIFHPDSEDRAFLNAHGLSTRVCRKANLPTEWDRMMHAQHRHKQEYSAYERAKAEEQVREYREQNRLMLEAQRAMIDAVREGKTAGVTKEE